MTCSRNGLVAAAGLAVFGASTAFVGPKGVAPCTAPALRGAAVEVEPTMVSARSIGSTVAVAAVAAAGAAALRRRQAVSKAALRRELAEAYEESGIELLDNGKFAQGLIGSEGAWGRYEFDPLNFTKWTELMPFFREAELKHGRICMLAWLGLVVPDFVRLPGAKYSFEAIPHAIDAHDNFIGLTGVDVQILFWIAFIELVTAKKIMEWNSIEVAGDFGLTALFPKDEEGQKQMKLKELKNARLAMMAFAGGVTQAVLTHHPFPWLY